jgi:hypothetical protein
MTNNYDILSHLESMEFGTELDGSFSLLTENPCSGDSVPSGKDGVK